MLKEFSYPLPDELFLNSFTENKVFSSIYDGPEKINVLVDKITSVISGIDPDDYNSDYYNLIEVNASINPEIAYFLLNSKEDYEYEYEEEILENGDIYNKILNPHITDAYVLVFNLEENRFELDLIVKINEYNYVVSHFQAIRNRLNFIVMNENGKKDKNEPLDVSDELLTKIKETIEDIDNYINSNPIICEWKYTNFNTLPQSILSISTEVETLLNTYQ